MASVAFGSEPYSHSFCRHAQLPLSSAMGLGRVKTLFRGSREKAGPDRPQAAIAAINGLVPTMFITRVRL